MIARLLLVLAAVALVPLAVASLVAFGAYAVFGATPAAAGAYGIGGRCVAFAERAPAGLPVTPREAPLPVELNIDGERRGWLYTCCGVDDARCADIPSGAVARELGLGRDCGDVNAAGLAACLGVEVWTPTDYQLFIGRPYTGQ